MMYMNTGLRKRLVALIVRIKCQTISIFSSWLLSYADETKFIKDIKEPKPNRQRGSIIFYCSK